MLSYGGDGVTVIDSAYRHFSQFFVMYGIVIYRPSKLRAFRRLQHQCRSDSAGDTRLPSPSLTSSQRSVLIVEHVILHDRARSGLSYGVVGERRVPSMDTGS